jgi:hypothetical protein
MMGCHRVLFAFLSAGIDTKANAWAAAHSKLVICVSLRMAASAQAPSSLISLEARLRARGGAGMMGEQACQGALTQEQTLPRAAAHPRLVICVSLRMAASAEAPSSPMLLPPMPPRLRARSGVGW